MIVVGVDPGLSGAMAWLRLDAPTNTAELLHVDDMPTAKARQASPKNHTSFYPNLRGSCHKAMPFTRLTPL